MRPTTKPTSRISNRLALGAAVGAFVLLGSLAVAPLAAPPSIAERRAEYIQRNAQEFRMPAAHAALAATNAMPPARDDFAATPGHETFIEGGTNHDWAKLVLLYGGWPITDSNVTVITRWMRQENYVDAWWTRNNPLNLGAGGYASNGNLDLAAQAVARTLSKGSGYRGIVEGFASSAETSEIEYAIWYSPWATGHYNDGKHWHYNPVPVVTAPPSAWGR